MYVVGGEEARGDGCMVRNEGMTVKAQGRVGMKDLGMTSKERRNGVKRRMERTG